MPTHRPFDPCFCEAVVGLAREGLGRAEIAVRLGVSLADFAAWAAEHPAFAAALADADTEARAWWEAQPREALQSGKPFRATIWARAMAQRYGRASDRSPQNAAERSAKTRPGDKPARVEAIFEIPVNGREGRRRPRGG